MGVTKKEVAMVLSANQKISEAYERLQKEHDTLKNSNSWIGVGSKLPDNETAVIISVLVKPVGITPFRRNVFAFYTDGKHTVSDSACAWGEIDERFEYNEDRDDFIIPEGWWESVQYGEEFYAVSDFVTHWMKQPQPPKDEETQ